MKSPITGKEMSLQKEERIISFRKEDFKVVYHHYLCVDSGEQFTSTELDEVNLNQVYNQYRDVHNLPFPDEIKAIREKYGLSATKMAEVLGFGVNVYRTYENGEVPSISNARLIQAIYNPVRFKEFVLLSDVYKGEELAKIVKKLDVIILEEQQNHFAMELEDYLMGDKLPDVYSGYRRPNLEKLTEMIIFFAECIQPWKTKMNKLLFYADFYHFKKTCFSISGARYRAIDMGPVPNNFNSIFEFICNKDEIDINRTEFPNGSLGERFEPNKARKFNPDMFTADEFSALQLVADKFSKSSTNDIIKISHEEDGWQHNFSAGKKMISYLYSFDLKNI